MFSFDILKKITQIKNSLSENLNKTSKLIVILPDKVDVLFNSDIIDKISYTTLVSEAKLIKTKNDLINTMEFEKNFTYNSVAKIEYYQSILSKFEGSQTTKDLMINKISDIKLDIGNIIDKFKDTSKVDALKKIITSEIKPQKSTLTITGKESKRSLDNTSVIIGDLSLSDLSLSIMISSHPAIEWSNWKISNEANQYFSIEECLWSNKGKKQQLKFKLLNNQPGLILSSLYDSYELTTSIGSIPSNLIIELSIESTDEVPFKKYLTTKVYIPSICVNKIISED
jgi:hypothetical protein